MAFYINGFGVGQDPDSFERNSTYNQNLNKLGSGENNIKVIDNFLPLDICNQLIKITETITLKDYGQNNFWDEMIYHSPNIDLEIKKYIPQIIEHIYNFYNIKVEKTGRPNITKWKPGHFLETHVDDLSKISPYHHISTVIYLNNNYEGGEIEFPVYNLKIKPKVGDLLIFPGNFNYIHKVNEIINGYRYTSPLWFKFLEEQNEYR